MAGLAGLSLCRALSTDKVKTVKKVLNVSKSNGVKKKKEKKRKNATYGDKPLVSQVILTSILFYTPQTCTDFGLLYVRLFISHQSLNIKL